MQKTLFTIIILFVLSGCSMPKKLEYTPQSKSINSALVIVDKRPGNEKLFREVVDTDISYFYGDNSFNLSLIEIMKDRLSNGTLRLNSSTKIIINKITLAASINNVNIDENRYQTVADPMTIGGGTDATTGAIIARPLITSIESGTSYRSVWCRIDYIINGKEYSERTVSAAKSSGLKDEIVSLYMQTIDRIRKNITH